MNNVSRRSLKYFGILKGKRSLFRVKYVTQYFYRLSLTLYSFKFYKALPLCNILKLADIESEKDELKATSETRLLEIDALSVELNELRQKDSLMDELHRKVKNLELELSSRQEEVCDHSIAFVLAIIHLKVKILECEIK